MEVPKRLHFTAINDVRPVLERVRCDLSGDDSDGAALPSPSDQSLPRDS